MLLMWERIDHIERQMGLVVAEAHVTGSSWNNTMVHATQALAPTLVQIALHKEAVLLVIDEAFRSKNALIQLVNQS